MVSNETIRTLVRGFEETDEHPHFHKIAFRVKKKIFATLDQEKQLLMVSLTLVDQSAFCAFDNTVIYPVPGGWGKQGATYIELKKVRKSTCVDALTTAYCKVAPPKLAEKYRASS